MLTLQHWSEDTSHTAIIIDNHHEVCELILIIHTISDFVQALVFLRPLKENIRHKKKYYFLSLKLHHLKIHLFGVRLRKREFTSLLPASRGI